jgi:hypothetical protein
MDEKATEATVQWYETAGRLAKDWFRSMSFKATVSLDEDDIRDFLVDLWFARGGQGKEFEEKNRGMLYSYCMQHLSHNRDALSKAKSLSDLRPAGRSDDGDDDVDEDRLQCLSYLDDEEAGEEQEQNEELVDLLDDLAAIRAPWLSSSLSEVLGISDRRARALASEARREKILALVIMAAKQQGMKLAVVKKLAAEIAAECRRSIKADGENAPQAHDEIEDFELMMGLSKPHVPAPATSIRAKIRSPLEKQQPQSVRPVQLELV